MFGAVIPDGYLIGLAPIFVLGVVGLFTWIVKELARISIQLSENARVILETRKDVEDHEIRLRQLEHR